MFKFDTLNNKKILKSDILKGAEHFFTTRETVVTPKNSDIPQSVCDDNLDDIANYLKISKENIISPEQTHSSNIAIAKSGSNYANTDALIVEDSDIAILLNFADCTPVILYDEVNNIGAVAHAGWRGTASAIAQKTVKFMINRYNSKPENIIAVIGPAISMKNYQVDKNVYDEVSKTLKGSYTDYFSYDKNANKFNIDLKTVNFHQLSELGIERIDKYNYCTYDSVDVFFSYRKENGITARHSAILKLNEK